MTELENLLLKQLKALTAQHTTQCNALSALLEDQSTRLNELSAQVEALASQARSWSKLAEH